MGLGQSIFQSFIQLAFALGTKICVATGHLPMMYLKAKGLATHFLKPVRVVGKNSKAYRVRDNRLKYTLLFVKEKVNTTGPYL